MLSRSASQHSSEHLCIVESDKQSLVNYPASDILCLVAYLHGEHRITAKKAARQQASHSDQHPHAHPLSLSISRQRPRSATSNSCRPQWCGGGGAADRGPVFYTPMGVSEVELPTAGLVPSHLSFLAEASPPPLLDRRGRALVSSCKSVIHRGGGYRCLDSLRKGKEERVADDVVKNGQRGRSRSLSPEYQRRRRRRTHPAYGMHTLSSSVRAHQQAVKWSPSPSSPSVPFRGGAGYGASSPNALEVSIPRWMP